MKFLVLLLASLLVSVSATKETVLETAFTSLGGNGRNGIDVSTDAKVDPIVGVGARLADENDDGKITKEEFKKISEDILGVFLQMTDIDSDGSLSEKELQEWGSTLKGFLSAIKIAFKVADANGDGFISTADYKEMLPQSVTKLDTNNDGRISLQEFQASEYGKSEDIKPLVKAIKRLDKNLDGQISLDEINNVVKGFWSMTDKDGNGYLDIDEGLDMLKKHGLSDEHVAAFKKIMKKAKDDTKIVTREYIKKIDANGDKQIDRNELIAVLNKPYTDLAKVQESYPEPESFMRPEAFTGPDRPDITQMINVFDNILDDPKFSEFSSSGKSTAMLIMVLMSVMIAFIL